MPNYFGLTQSEICCTFVLVDWFFTKRIEMFIKHWLYDTLDAEWHWYRHEYQSLRGSIHCHGTAKLKNDPGLCDLTEKALKGFLAQKEVDKEEPLTPQHEELIQEGLEASRTVCQYADWLFSSCNPCPPNGSTWIKPQLHPFKKNMLILCQRILIQIILTC